MHELLVSRSGHLCQVVDPNVAGVLIIKTEKSTQNNITCVGTIIFICVAEVMLNDVIHSESQLFG